MQGYLQQVSYQAGAACIAECECAMLLFTMWRMREILRGRRVLWMVDNSASLFGVIKGLSGNAINCRTIELIHFIMYHFNITVWWEFVDSESNYIDGISRDLEADAWARHHGMIPEDRGLTLCMLFFMCYAC